MPEPLISVMMPSYNCAQTLPMAIASLQAQTYEEWECLLVDDGSTDNTEALVRCIDEPRVRYLKFEKNRGRPAARQHALLNARGEYMTMLDADDWLFPEKFARQLDVFAAHPDLALVSSGMNVVNGDNELTHVQGRSDQSVEVLGPWDKLSVPFSHAASMIKLDTLALYPYDPRLPRCQDQDFLMRLLRGRYGAIIHAPLYVYWQEYGPRVEKTTLDSLYYQRIVYQKHLTARPLEAAPKWLVARIKHPIYRLASTVGMGQRLFDRRYNQPSQEDKQALSRALAQVTDCLNVMQLS